MGEQADDGVHVFDFHVVDEVCGLEAMQGQIALEDFPCAGALLPQQQALPEQIVEGGGLAGGENVAAGTDADIGLGAIRAAEVVLGREVALDQGHLDAAGSQLGQELLGVAEAQPDVDAGVGQLIGGQRRYDGIFADGHRDAERQCADAGLAAEELSGERDLVVLHGLAALEENLASGRELEFFVRIAEGLDLIIVFQKADVLGDGRLGDV